jgi:hypothetical protein
VNKFRLSDLGEALKDLVIDRFPSMLSIDWDLSNYNLHTDQVSGMLRLNIDTSDNAEEFNRLLVTLLLSNLNVNVLSVTYSAGIQVTNEVFHYNTSISLVDYPEIALGNYIKDSKETLTYAWER